MCQLSLSLQHAEVGSKNVVFIITHCTEEETEEQRLSNLHKVTHLQSRGLLFGQPRSKTQGLSHYAILPV